MPIAPSKPRKASTPTRARRPRLTRKRIDGLQRVADLAESSVWKETIDQPLPKTALAWIRGMGTWGAHKSQRKEAPDGEDLHPRR